MLILGYRNVTVEPPCWLSGVRIHLPMQETGLIPGLGRSHMPQSNEARGLQLLSLCSKALLLQLLQPKHLGSVLFNKRSHHTEAQTPQLESSSAHLN